MGRTVVVGTQSGDSEMRSSTMGSDFLSIWPEINKMLSSSEWTPVDF